MYSLRDHLTLMLVVGMSLFLVGAGLLMNVAMSSRLLHEFDQDLVTKTKILISLIEKAGTEIKFDFKDNLMPEFFQAEDPEYVAIRLASGTLLKKSQSLRDHELPYLSRLESAPIFRDLVLPNGRSGRLVQIVFVPHINEGEAEKNSASQNAGTHERKEEPASMENVTRDPGLFPDRAVILSVARSRVRLDSLLRTLHLTLAGGIAGLLIVMAMFVRLAVRLGLYPLEAVRQQIAQLDVNSFNTHAQMHTQTWELMPVVHQLNAMLRRLDDAFTREGQFSRDLAHELRTPLAELRMLAEVGGRWPDDRDAVVAYFADARAICEQMERVVISLLARTRCESGVQQVSCASHSTSSM